jgi:NhaP-type Na+/H+ or K+/H+ antiporter
LKNNASRAIIAIVAALALRGVVVVTVAFTIPLQQEAEAKGCPGSTPAFNVSKGRCHFHP